VNRKECARIVLELPRWFTWGTFKEKGRAGPEPAVEESAAIMGWALENTILEVSILLHNF
jgi:nuclear cap-binding protein subunit 1